MGARVLPLLLLRSVTVVCPHHPLQRPVPGSACGLGTGCLNCMLVNRCPSAPEGPCLLPRGASCAALLA